VVTCAIYNVNETLFRGAAEIRANKVNEAHDVGSSPVNRQPSRVRTCTQFGSLAKAVLTNPTYVALTFFSVCDNFTIGGLIAYGPKFYQYALYMTPTVAGITYGISTHFAHENIIIRLP
jgi:Organic Anion Transporter Polypeptide (OATP) family